MTLPATGQLSLKSVWEEKSGITYSANFQDLSLRGLSSDTYNDYYDVPTTTFVNILGTPNSAAQYSLSEFYDWTSNTTVNKGYAQPFYGYQSGNFGSISGNTTIPNTNIAITQMYRYVLVFKGGSTYTFFLTAASATTQNVFTSLTTSGTTLTTSTATFSGSSSSTWSWGLTSTQLTDWNSTAGTLQVAWAS